jgi:enterochelin esterase-like enzyme/formylglycine-generating enzyme required for sulfatase activity
MSAESLDPLVPRGIDLPTAVPLDPGADLTTLDDGKILAAPTDPADLPRWRARLEQWRRQARERIGYRDELYADPAFDWIADCFAVSLAWLWDEALYDHRAGVFRPDAYLDAMTRDFGGIDGVVLWHAYPIIGIDDRDQFDFYRQVPGLGDLVQSFQRRGVRVFVDYNPWDVAAGRSADDPESLARLVRDLDVDGVFLDTMTEGAHDLRRALDAVRPGVALEGESRLPLTRVHDHPMSWAQWFADSRPMPGVLRARWFERRHMVHHTRRWHRDHAEELHSAWLNGTGVLVWESVFGSWVGWNERDRSILRSMLPVQRRFRHHLTSGAWTPLADRPRRAGADHPIHASRFELDGSALWTIVNTSDRAYDGPLLSTDDRSGARWYELTTGREVSVETSGGRIELEGHLPPSGVAAIVALPPEAVDRAFEDFLSDRAANVWRDEHGFPGRPSARIVPAASTLIPRSTDVFVDVAGGRRTLDITYRLRETGMYDGAPFADEWKPLPPRLHRTVSERHHTDVPPVRVARRQVTNADYQRFLADTGYRPDRPERFLAPWSNGRPAVGTEGDAVTYVDLDDARAYAAWAGLRLPTEFEWQAAAETGAFEHDGPRRWDLTESEHTDGRTRFVILKGGSDHASIGSDWYVDGGPQTPDVSLKLLRPGAPVARSAWISFRCVADLGSGPSANGARVTIERAPSPALGGSIEFARYRPSRPGPADRLPVIYLLHGRGGSLTDWFTFTERLDTMISEGRIPPVLVVMPDAPWSERASWYVDSSFTGPAGQGGRGRGRPVERALIQDLVDHIDATSPTIPAREARVVAGASMGGAGALGMCLGNPDRFGAAAIIAPAVYDGLPPADSTIRTSGAFGRGRERFVESVYRANDPIARLIAATPRRPIRLAFGCGDREPVRSDPAEVDDELLATTTRLYDRLRRVPGVEASLDVVPGGHDPSTWATALEHTLRRLIGGVRVDAHDGVDKRP